MLLLCVLWAYLLVTIVESGYDSVQNEDIPSTNALLSN